MLCYSNIEVLPVTFVVVEFLQSWSGVLGAYARTADLHMVETLSEQ